MMLIKLAAAAFIAAFLLMPLNGQANIASGIQNGVPADQVIANALADGLTLDQIADQIAQQVGSANIGMFAGALARVAAAATDTSPGDPSLVAAVNAAIGAAAGNNHSAQSAGQAYAMNAANFAPVDVSAIRGTTGVLSLSSIAPSNMGLSIAGRRGGAPGAGAPGAGSGGGGGRGIQDAVCEAVGSEPGCLD